MREEYAGVGFRTNSGPHECAVRDRTIVRSETLTARLMRVAHDLFGRDGLVFGRDSFPKWIARRTRRSPRTVEYWLADDRAMDLESFHRLVCADTAYLDAFIQSLPADTRDAWLREKILEVRLAKAERRAAAQRDEIAQLRSELRR